jgi:hypothetical protein
VQLLRASSQHSGQGYDLRAVTQGAAVGDCGIPEGGLLIEFAETILGGDEVRLARARAAIVAAMGAAALVDAAGIAGLFNAIDRVADATGAPLEETKAADTASLRAAIGIDEFDAVRARLEQNGGIPAR